MLALVSGPARATILPDLGAGLGALECGGVALLRPWSGVVADGPFALALNLLAPFSNRISRPFAFGGTEYPVPANLPGEDFAIHGDAFQRVWQVAEATADAARLTLAGGIGPFVHDAEATYRLAADHLTCTLAMTNRGTATLPFGGGFHPWFPRDADTVLGFRADGYWPEDARHLPATTEPAPLPPGLRFDPPAPLPDGFVNNGFAGWDGQATIATGAFRLALQSWGLSSAILYSPGAHSGFFCFEPVSHPVDAHNLPGQPGLVPLSPGASLAFSMSLRWDII